MSHHDHHDHGGHHHHDSEDSSGVEKTFDERLVVLLDHWIKHNDDHARNYMDWGRKAEEHQLSGVGALLNEAAEMTRAISEKFEKAAALAGKKR
ncbi:MAG: hypothetical protein HKM93_22135 [Desulfobacteraceae bacterium]|nr:hypothetical protein [Desulfobacteraceae bacterium]